MTSVIISLIQGNGQGLHPAWAPQTHLMAIVAYQMCFYLRVRLEPVLEKALQAEEA